MRGRPPSGLPVNGDRATIRTRDGALHYNTNPKRWKKALAGHIKSAHKGKMVPECAACIELSAHADGAQK